MPLVNVNIINEAYRAAFGIAVRRLLLPTPERQGSITEHKDVRLLDVPVQDQLSIAAGKTPRGQSYSKYDFDVDPLIEINRRKNIVETKIAGRTEGTVKELIGKEDWQIRIRGLIVGSNGQYPFDEVAELAQICDYDTSLEVSSALFNLFGITNLVISEYSFPALQGFPDTQPFEITAMSDKPIELEIGDV